MKISYVTPHHIIIAAGSKLFSFDIKKAQQISNSDDESKTASSLYEVLDLNTNGESPILSVVCNHTFSVLLVAYADKKIISYDLTSRTILGEIMMRKRPTALDCATFQDLLSSSSSSSSGINSREVLIVSDKSGCIWGVDVPLLKRSVELGGHTSSVITDLLVVGSSESKYIVTSDRDEKIRVSNFPNTGTISMYCLGHTSVITSLSTVSTSDRSSGEQKGDTDTSSSCRIVSCSWDNTLSLWDATSGHLLSQLSLLSPSANVPVTTTSHEKESVKDMAVTNDSKLDSHGIHTMDDGHKEKEEVDNNDDHDDDDNDGMSEKQYDEHAAGSYPLQVASNNSFVAVIFRDLSEVRLYSISNTSSLQYVRTYVLTSLPTHIFFPSTDTLSVICAKPLYIRSIPLPSLNHDFMTVDQSMMQERTDLMMPVNNMVNRMSVAFASFCTSQGIYIVVHLLLNCF